MLHGIPILIKDTISAHGTNNTAGSYCLVGAKPKNEASLVTRLREAGAIILGKANTSEWGNGRSSGDNASNGWSSWGGQTYGVYSDTQDPCGSSSGSATSMALGLAAVTIGVEVSLSQVMHFSCRKETDLSEECRKYYLPRNEEQPRQHQAYLETSP